jgi:hypothetical protein
MMMVRRWMVDGRTMDGPPVAGADALKANHPLHSLKISKDANFEYHHASQYSYVRKCHCFKIQFLLEFVIFNLPFTYTRTS